MTRRRGHKVYALDDGTLVAANQELMTGDDQVGPTPGVPLTVTSLGGASGVAQTLYGTGAPSNGLGNNGDTYVDPLALLRYGPKSGGQWPAAVDLAALGAVPTPLAGAFAKTGSGSMVATSADGVTTNLLTTAGTGVVERIDYVLTAPVDLRKKAVCVPVMPSVALGWSQIYLQIAPSSALAALKLYNIGANDKVFRAGLPTLITFTPEMLFSQSGTVDLSAVGLIGLAVNDGGSSKTIGMGKPMLLA